MSYTHEQLLTMPDCYPFVLTINRPLIIPGFEFQAGMAFLAVKFVSTDGDVAIWVEGELYYLTRMQYVKVIQGYTNPNWRYGATPLVQQVNTLALYNALIAEGYMASISHQLLEDDSNEYDNYVLLDGYSYIYDNLGYRDNTGRILNLDINDTLAIIKGHA